MVTFLTGVITDTPWPNPMIGVITETNGFRGMLLKYWKQPSRCLFMSCDPYKFEENDMTLIFYREAFKRSGFEVECFDMLDARYKDDFDFERFASYDVLIFGSGRMPDQYALMKELHLREFLQGEGDVTFDGIVLGISAGAMNCAEIAYNWPEEPGDTIDPEFQLFYQGLGVVKTQILPHFQDRYEMQVDGRSLFYDITIKDSIGHEFLAMPDYTYVIAKDGVEKVFGNHFYYRDGVLLNEDNK